MLVYDLLQEKNIKNEFTDRVEKAIKCSFWLMALVSRSASGSRWFKRVDFPTPELPQNAHSLPLIHVSFEKQHLFLFFVDNDLIFFFHSFKITCYLL